MPMPSSRRNAWQMMLGSAGQGKVVKTPYFVVGYLGNDTGMIMVWEKGMSSQVDLYIQHV